MKINESIKTIVRMLDEANLFIDKNEPWLKDGSELRGIMGSLYLALYKINIILSPILIKSTNMFFWSLGKANLTFSDINDDLSEIIIVPIENLFERKK
jgi:methionyl-tRNA synthetase